MPDTVQIPVVRAIRTTDEVEVPLDFEHGDEVEGYAYSSLYDAYVPENLVEHRNWDIISSEDWDYFRCDNCGDTFHEDDYWWDSMCDACFHEHNDDDDDDDDDDDRPNRLKSYGTTRPHTWYKTKTEDQDVNLFFGVELEFNYAQDDENRHRMMDGFFEAKEDASLEEWVEFVSQPFTQARRLENREAVIENVQKINGESWQETWLHVHMSRVAFTEEQLKYMAKFIWVNDVEWCVMAGRRSHRGAVHKCNRKDTDDKAYYRYNDNRRSAINLTSSKTCEIRAYRNSRIPRHRAWRIEISMLLAKRAILKTSHRNSTKYSRGKFVTFCMKQKQFTYAHQLLKEKFSYYFK
jgi:hypothetical protein